MLLTLYYVIIQKTMSPRNSEDNVILFGRRFVYPTKVSAEAVVQRCSVKKVLGLQLYLKSIFL